MHRLFINFNLHSMKKKYVYFLLCIEESIGVKMQILKRKGKIFYERVRKRLFRSKNSKRMRQESACLWVEYIRKLAFLFYQYEGHYEMFYRQAYNLLEQEFVLGRGKNILCEMVNVCLDGIWDKLKSKHAKFREEDLEFMCLLAAGFTPSELTVIFGWKRLESVYVKSSRLGKRLNLEIPLVEYLQTYRTKD